MIHLRMLSRVLGYSIIVIFNLAFLITMIFTVLDILNILDIAGIDRSILYWMKVLYIEITGIAVGLVLLLISYLDKM